MRLVFPGKDTRGDPELFAAILSEIDADDGAIPFARYMELCLQHPTRGYYRRGRTRAGHGGDFLTSPEAHPSFGGAMARQLGVFAELLGRDAPVFVEAGAGSGTMANVVAAALPPRARVVAVDTAAHVHPSEDGDAAPWRVRAAGLPFADGTVDAIYANELLDAFPVHRLRRAGAGWTELCVGREGDTLRWVEREASREARALGDAALARGGRAEDGQIVEVSPGLGPWIREAGRVVRRGFVLLVDYGHDTPRLVTPENREGTLRCFAGHAIHHDPLVFAGTQDMTANVDFGHLVAEARGAGFETVAFVDQRAWLLAWGVGAARDGLLARAEKGEMRVDDAENNVAAVDYLLDPRGLGKLRVIAFAKGLAPMPVPGLTGDVPAARRFTAEDLPITKLFDPFGGIGE